MTLQERVDSDLKDAMRAKDAVKLGVLRMVKSALTVRTGNAWVHVWAYHAIAPHVWLDTPVIVDALGIH